MPDLSPFELTGKVAVVTGGNGGIGLGIAMGLAGAGANIVVAARSVEKTAQALEDIRALGVEAHGITVDVTQDRRSSAWSPTPSTTWAVWTS